MYLDHLPAPLAGIIFILIVNFQIMMMPLLTHFIFTLIKMNKIIKRSIYEAAVR